MTITGGWDNRWSHRKLKDLVEEASKPYIVDCRKKGKDWLLTKLKIFHPERDPDEE